jgi:phytoene dehydrogenase-like protein/ferredoxin-NADP reductase
MTNTFDAIIVGSGLGGLTAAATLAGNGYKVAVFERHSQPGGYATTFVRDNFEFEVSLHAMSGIGTSENPGPLYSFYRELGIMDRVTFIPMPDLYRTIADGVDITVPRSPKAAESILVEAFPHEAEGIRQFIGQIMTVGEEVQLIREGGYSTSPLPTLVRFPSLAHAAGTTVSDVLDMLVTDPKVKLVLGQLWGYFGLPPQKLSFLLFAAGVSSYLRWGSVTIKGKSQSLSNAYADVIRQNRGEVMLSEGVREILVENNRVTGVISDRGVRYTADTVISNADPYSTVNRLMKPEHVSPSFRRRLEAAEPSAGTVTLYLGLNRSSREVGIDNHELYINLTDDMNEQWKRCTSLTPPGVVSVCAYDVSNPHFAPAGKGVVAITVLQQGAPWTALSDEVYALEKDRHGDMLLRIVSHKFPKLLDAVETRVVSTPVTNVRYTGNSQGAIYGFANTPEENPGFRMDNRGPVNGLWFAGAWTRPSAGYQGVITSGYNTATDIMAQWGHRNRLPYGVSSERPASTATLPRRWQGWKLLLRDGKRVGEVVRSKYRKYSNDPIATDFVSTYDRSARFHAENRQMTVVSRYLETSDTVTLRLFAENAGQLKFRPGQYVDITADIRGERVTRAYSISSAPTMAACIEITVKAQTGGKMSPWLVNDVQVGDKLAVTGPFGDFGWVASRDTADLVLVAVGSGITPMMSMLRKLDGVTGSPDVHLIYGSRSEREIIFRHELTELALRNPNIRITHVLSGPSVFWPGHRGRISSDIVLESLNERLDRKTFFICGPSAMYRPLVETLDLYGVPRRQIRFESFNTLDSQDKKPIFQIFRSDMFHDTKTPSVEGEPHIPALCHLAENPSLHTSFRTDYRTSLNYSGIQYRH